MPSSPLRALHHCKETVLLWGDLHAPFHHPDALAFLAWVKKKFKPTKVICMGDELDFHSVSFHQSDPDGYSPGHEMRRAIDTLKPFYKLFPEVMVCHSNHTARPFRKAFASGIPAQAFKSMRDMLEAPKGWEWRDKWQCDGFWAEHGEGVSGQNAGLKAADANMACTAVGHLHSWSGVNYAANAETLYWGLVVPSLIDRKAYAFAYGKHMKRKPIIGCAVVDRGIPHVVPLLLDKTGRWVGRAKHGQAAN